MKATIKYKTIRRVRITAPMSERQEVFAWAHKNGYLIRYSGAKHLGGGGKVDITKLVVVAEKEIK